MLDYEEIENTTLNSVLLIELIQRKINHIKSSTTSDVDLALKYLTILKEV